MIKYELVEKLPQPWLIKAVAFYKGTHYVIFINPETGEDELWQIKVDTGEVNKIDELPKQLLPPKSEYAL